MGAVCVCMNPEKNKSSYINLNDTKDKEFDTETYTNYDKINDSKKDFIPDLEPEVAKTGLISHEKSHQQNIHGTESCIDDNIQFIEYDERLRPGVIVANDQVPPKLAQKVLEIESVLNKFELTEEEKELVANPELKNFTILCPDNKIYDCQFNKRWEKEGYGFIYYPNGSKYEGIFRNNSISRGRLINAEGDYYEGILFQLC